MGINADRWVAIPNMHHIQGCFHPCEYRKFVYLPGITTIEIFDPRKYTFSQFVIPSLEHGYESLAFVENDHLFIMSNSWLSKWTLNPDNSLELLSTIPLRAFQSIYTNAPIVDTVNQVVYHCGRYSLICVKLWDGDVQKVLGSV